MTPVLVFDIETIPDVAGLRAAWGFDAAMPDEEVAEQAFARRRERTGGSDFLPLHFHRIVAIGCLLRDDRGVQVRCLGQADESEARQVQQFFKLVDRHTPQLVTWNGGGFDLQVLHYRALIHQVQASRYWDQGEDDRDFKYNNYLSRYHSRHLDLMDLLSLYNGRASAPLDELAKLCGFPGKLGMDGSQVWPAWREGRIDEIRSYCETDVANTWLLYCRFQLLRGQWSPERYQQEISLTRGALGELAAQQGHWREFVDAWPE